MTKRRPAQMNQEIDGSIRRHKVTDESINQIEEALSTISDDDTRLALMEVAHILTGDDRFEATTEAQ